MKEKLEDFDWDDLEARFCAQMEECRREEEVIGEEFREWVEVCFYFVYFVVSFSWGEKKGHEEKI